MPEFAGKRVTVCGLGRFGGGIGVTRWLVAEGASVLVTDTAQPDALKDACARLADLKVEYRLGEHRTEDFVNADLVVASPAVPPQSEFLQAARLAGVPVTTEIRLFIERCRARIFGVTGTKGKSTTTAMLGRMLARKYATHVGGNIGGSLLFDVPKIQADHLVVLELSSFMLEYLAPTQWSPHVALVTMIVADHLDRHDGLAGYIDAKKTIVRFQGADDYAILNEQCPRTADFALATRAHVVLFGTANRRRFRLLLPGEHNQVNAQAAFAAAAVKDITWEQAQSAIVDFRGLPHRLEQVHEDRGVRYFNDSIATIPEAAIAALESFAPKTVIQIVGGSDKGLPFGAMASALGERAKAVLCIGATGPTIADLLGQAARIGSAPTHCCGDLATAMKLARQLAQSGDVVLLSTGCASYDQFRNFEHRGEEFARLAREG
jgi:UDP-N-acetylmuramoylalanine--D-glutamate ligase